MMRQVLRLLAALVFIGIAVPAFAQWQVPNHYVPVGKGAGSGFSSAAVGTAGRLFVDKGASADPAFVAVSGDCGITSSGVVTCTKANGVSMPSSVTSGGVLYGSSTSAIASSALLTANQIILGGGAGTAPASLGSLGTTTTLLHGNASGAPTFGAVVSSDMNITTTSCTNQFVTAISSGGVGTCTTDTLAGAQHANQGTTTTVLHGNASGNPSWGAVNFATDGTGVLPAANGGAGTITGALKGNGSGTVSQAAASDLSNGTTGSGSVVLAAGPSLSGAVNNTGTLKLSSFVTSTQITAAQNDYTASDGSNTCSTKGTLRLSSDASRNITGLSCGQAEGDVRILHNVGAQNIVLTNQDAGSTAANRFLFGGDMTLAADTSVTIRYDGVTSRWRAITTPGAGGGGGSGTVTSVTLGAGTGIAITGTNPITSSGTATISIADQDRQNALLGCADAAKFNAGYIRRIETFCDGYKASDGVNSGSSSNYTVNTTSGYVGPSLTVNYLVVGGGGGGGQIGGGGGGGGVRTGSLAAPSSSTVTVGAGGAHDASGSNSVFGAITALGGGSGGSRGQAAAVGGSGGGGADAVANLTGASGTAGQGNSGGNGNGTVVNGGSGAGGGGGAGAAGANASSSTVAGAGGAGVASSISGSSATYGGGGGGGSGNTSGGTAGAGGAGGGGNGGNGGVGSNGTANTGGGGGGGGNNFAGGSGGSGIVIISYSDAGGQLGTGGTVTHVGGNYIHTFTSSGTFTVSAPNMTLVTAAQTADATVATGRILVEYDPIDATTLNTDLTGEISCDGGSHWASATFSSAGKGQAGRTVAETADQSCGASGTSFAARLKTLNNKNVNLYKTTVTVH